MWTFWALLILAQQNPVGADAEAPATWARFYRDAVKPYQIARIDGLPGPQLVERPIFNWTSIDHFHGSVFAWTDNGRPTLVASIFSFPIQDSKQRHMVHEFASFADTKLVVDIPDKAHWAPPALQDLERIPGAPRPPGNVNALKLQCRQLAKEFSAHMNRRGDRWDLRLLPAPLLEYQQPKEGILGGALFAFVGYTTDPEILLLLEARRTADGPQWHFHPVRFSDKSLYLQFQDQPVWKSLRRGHDSEESTDDPLYRVVASQRLSQEFVEKLSMPAKND